MPCCWPAWPSARRPRAALTAIVTADANDAQRLLDEIAFFAPDLRCALFPDWETLPYDTFSPHQDLISERLATLWRISQRRGRRGDRAGHHRAVPRGAAGLPGGLHLPLQGQAEAGGGRLKAQLTLAGYSHVTQVVSPGEYAVRGGLIDLFPMGSPVPYRVDLFDDEIDSIRTFDPDSQRSLYPVPEVRLLPGREFPMDDDARARFRSRWRELLEGDPTKSRIYKDMGNGVATAGIEYYLPLFFEDTATVFDYLGDAGHRGAARRPGAGLPALLAGHARPLPPGAGRPRAAGAAARGAVPDGRAVLRAAPTRMRSWRCAAAARRTWRDSALRSRTLPDAGRGARRRGPAGRASSSTCRNTPHRVLVLAESDGRRESLLDFLRASQLSPPAFDSLAEFQASDEKLGIATAALTSGFSLARGRHRLRHRDRAVRRRPDHAPAQEAGAGQRRRGADQGPVGAERRRPGGARAARHRPLPRPGQHGPGPGHDRGSPRCRSSCTWNTPTRPRSTCR